MKNEYKINTSRLPSGQYSIKITHVETGESESQLLRKGADPTHVAKVLTKILHDRLTKQEEES